MTNNKSLCKTYADRAQQLYFVNTYLRTNSSTCDASNYTIEQISEPPILLCAKTASDAIELKEYLLTVKELPEDVHTCYKCGIVVGVGKIVSLDDRQMADIKFWLEKDHLANLDEELPQVAQTFRRIFKPNDYDLGVMYRVGEFVVLQDSLFERREWVMEICSIIVYGPIANKYKTFVDGNYFAAKTFPNSTELDIDKWSGQPKMVCREFRRLCVQPTEFIDRKIMLYPVNNSRGSLSYYLITDPDCPVICENVTVPHYPQVGDVVRLNSPDEIKLVSSVDADNKCCCCHPMRKVGGRNSRWTVNRSIQQTVSFLNILCNISYRTNGGCYYLMM